MTWLLLVLQVASAASTGCDEDALLRLAQARAAKLRGDTRAADAAFANVAGAPCEFLVLAQLSWRGWGQARALAPLGGAAEHMEPAGATLTALQPLRASPDLTIEAEYADTTIRAAIAAAQDERPEMELRLTHARDLAERLQMRDRRAEWPLPFNLIAGELWFEVDRYQDAASAFERAVSAEVTPRALVGLARALARLQRMDEACAYWKRAGGASADLRALAAKDLAGCR
jgi:hypothetical protein